MRARLRPDVRGKVDLMVAVGALATARRAMRAKRRVVDAILILD